jgi:hypothetical protein
MSLTDGALLRPEGTAQASFLRDKPWRTAADIAVRQRNGGSNEQSDRILV